MTKKTLIIIILILSSLFFLYQFADTFSPGSYGHAERYELDYPEEKVIEAIKKLKEANKELIVPKVTVQNSRQWSLNDGKEKESDHWYKVYFYDKGKNQILFTWTRPSGPNTTTFAFVAINDDLDLRHWKEINNDFGFFENRKVIQVFEKRILRRIKDNLNHQ
jgi:hypothetical protein